MSRATSRCALALAIGLTLATEALAGAPSKKAVYQGGTIGAVPTAAVGSVSTLDGGSFVFQYQAGSLEIPYEQVNALEYGQKSSRRLGLAIAVSPLFLLSKRRRHFLTVSYVDDFERQQAAVFELGKKVVRTTLAGLEARTGLRVEFEDERARRAAGQ